MSNRQQALSAILRLPTEVLNELLAGIPDNDLPSDYLSSLNPEPIEASPDAFSFLSVQNGGMADNTTGEGLFNDLGLLLADFSFIPEGNDPLQRKNIPLRKSDKLKVSEDATKLEFPELWDDAPRKSAPRYEESPDLPYFMDDSNNA